MEWASIWNCFNFGRILRRIQQKSVFANRSKGVQNESMRFYNTWVQSLWWISNFVKIGSGYVMLLNLLNERTSNMFQNFRLFYRSARTIKEQCIRRKLLSLWKTLLFNRSIQKRRTDNVNASSSFFKKRFFLIGCLLNRYKWTKTLYCNSMHLVGIIQQKKTICTTFRQIGLLVAVLTIENLEIERMFYELPRKI